MRKILTAALLLSLAASTATGDVLVLIDGEQIVGEVRREHRNGQDGYLVSIGNEQRFIRLDRVRRHVIGRDTVEAPEPLGDASEDAIRLESLRRATAGLTDIDLTLKKYDAFLDDAMDAAVVIAANADRRQWELRQVGGFVKVGDDWMTPADRQTLLAAALARIDDARQAVSQDAADALPLVESLLADPLTQPAGAYLSGVVALQAGQLSTARQQFERVRAVNPTHAPTLVNLAVIQTQLGRPERATWFMAEAIAAASDRRSVLDAAAELLNMLDEPRDRNAEKLAAVFAEHDKTMQQQLKEQGLYRYGGIWIDAERRKAIEEEQAEVEAAVGELKSQYDTLAQEIRLIEREVSANEAAMRQIEIQSTVRDAEGRLIRLPLPAEFGRLQADNERLIVDRNQLVAQATQLENEAQQLRQAVDRGSFTGKMEPVGADGVPVP